MAIKVLAVLIALQMVYLFTPHFHFGSVTRDSYRRQERMNALKQMAETQSQAAVEEYRKELGLTLQHQAKVLFIVEIGATVVDGLLLLYIAVGLIKRNRRSVLMVKSHGPIAPLH